MSRPPPPLLPLNNIKLKKTGGANNNKQKNKKSNRSISDVVKATLRYMKSRRLELLDCDQSKENTKCALETIEKQINEWNTLIEHDKFKSIDNDENNMKKFEKVVVKDHSWNFDHEKAFAIPVKEFSNLDWSTITSIGKSVEGTEGVFFIKFPNERAIVVKSSTTLGAEVYGAILAKRIGVATPGIRIINRNSNEGSNIVRNLIKQDARVEQYLSKPFFILMEYIKGIVLGDVILNVENNNNNNNNNNENKFIIQKFGNPPESLHDVGKNNLLQFGRMIGLDFITNNFDRFPVVWDNTGNPGNVMFYGNVEEDGVVTELANRIVAIDNMTSCISKTKFKKEYDAYAMKTSEVLSKLFKNPIEINEAFARVQSFLKNGVPNGGWPGLQMDIGESGIRLVQEGFLESLASVGDMEPNELFAIKDALENLFLKDNNNNNDNDNNNNNSNYKNNFSYGLERVDPEFIVAIATTMHDAVASDLNALGKSSPNLKEKEIQSSSPVQSDDGNNKKINDKSPINRIVQFDSSSTNDKNVDVVVASETKSNNIDVNNQHDDAKTTKEITLNDQDRRNMDINSINTMLGSSDIIWGKPFRPAIELSNQITTSVMSRSRRFVSEIERRGIRRKKNEQSGVCIVS